MRRYLCLLAIIFTFAFPSAGRALKTQEPLDAKTIAVCNEALKALFDEAVALKGEYKELSQFDEKVLSKNDLGIYVISYTYQEEVEERGGAITIRKPYSFGLTLVRIGDDNPYESQTDSFSYGFPAAKVKVVGYQKKKLMRIPFDILPLVSKHGRLIDKYQQQFLPVRLVVTTAKPVYAVGEAVEYLIKVENISQANMVVKKPTEETVFMMINGESWGNTFWDEPPEEVSSGRPRRTGGRPRRSARSKSYVDLKKISGLLLPGESFEMKLEGRGFSDPQDVNIEAIYEVPYRDVYPTAYYSFTVTEK